MQAQLNGSETAGNGVTVITQLQIVWMTAAQVALGVGAGTSPGAAQAAAIAAGQTITLSAAQDLANFYQAANRGVSLNAAGVPINPGAALAATTTYYVSTQTTDSSYGQGNWSYTGASFTTPSGATTTAAPTTTTTVSPTTTTTTTAAPTGTLLDYLFNRAGGLDTSNFTALHFTYEDATGIHIAESYPNTVDGFVYNTPWNPSTSRTYKFVGKLTAQGLVSGHQDHMYPLCLRQGTAPNAPAVTRSDTFALDLLFAAGNPAAFYAQTSGPYTAIGPYTVSLNTVYYFYIQLTPTTCRAYATTVGGTIIVDTGALAWSAVTALAGGNSWYVGAMWQAAEVSGGAGTFLGSEFIVTSP